MPRRSALPTQNPAPRPRLTQEQVAVHMEDVATCANVDPLSLHREIASAYMAGVPLMVLARWFGASGRMMSDLINAHIMGREELARVTKAQQVRKVAANTDAIPSPTAD